MAQVQRQSAFAPQPPARRLVGQSLRPQDLRHAAAIALLAPDVVGVKRPAAAQMVDHLVARRQLGALRKRFAWRRHAATGGLIRRTGWSSVSSGWLRRYRRL